MIVWLVFDGNWQFKLACTDEQIAKNVVAKYNSYWKVKAFDTDFGDGFVSKVLYKVVVKNDKSVIKADTKQEIEQYGFGEYYRELPIVTKIGDANEVILMAHDARDAIDKALEILNGNKDG